MMADPVLTSTTESPGHGLCGNACDPPAPEALLPVLHLDGFDGPIDVLLALAERQRIDLARLSIVALAEQFVAALESAAMQVPVERRAEWLVLATRLIVLRSRLLLPQAAEAVEDAAHEAAREIERLEERRFISAAASWLQARPQLGQEVFTRPQSGPAPRIVSYMALLEACLAVLQQDHAAVATGAPVYQPPVVALFRIPGAITRMRAILAGLTEATPFEAFLPHVPKTVKDRDLVARSAVSSTFVAALELARRTEGALDQKQAFGPIHVGPVGGAART